jgi:hypothetical protein
MTRSRVVTQRQDRREFALAHGATFRTVALPRYRAAVASTVVAVMLFRDWLDDGPEQTDDLGRLIVDAWNAVRLDDLMDAYADQVRLGSFAPGTSASGKICAKAEMHALLSGARQDRPVLELVSSLESDRSLSLVLRDVDGKLFTVSFELDADRKITSVMSVRTQ